MKKAGMMLLALTIAVSLMFWAAPTTSAETPVVLNPVADSYIDSEHPIDNFGGSDYLEAHTVIYKSLENEYQVSYLKFDLSSIPANATINSAELQLYSHYTSSTTAHIGAHYCQDNTWSEIGISWNNAPSYASEATDIVDIAFEDNWYSWDVTSDVQKALSNRELTEVMKSERTASGIESVSFYSKDAYWEEKIPRLIVTVSENDPPNTPSNPSPANDATGVSINADLSWTGGDPDVGDTVTYDVYFGTSTTPPLVSDNQAGTSYDPRTLAYNTKYYWKIIATDSHGASTTSPLWDFTTEPGGWAPWVYDENDSSYIEIDELLHAISDYIVGKITISNLLEVINLYISHTHR